MLQNETEGVQTRERPNGEPWRAIQLDKRWWNVWEWVSWVSQPYNRVPEKCCLVSLIAEAQDRWRFISRTSGHSFCLVDKMTMTLLGKPHGPKDDNMTQILLAWAERDRDRTEWSRSKTKQSRTHSLTAWQKWHRSMETFVSLSLSVYKRVDPQRNGNFPQESYTDIFQKSQKGLSYTVLMTVRLSHMRGLNPRK